MADRMIDALIREKGARAIPGMERADPDRLAKCGWRNMARRAQELTLELRAIQQHLQAAMLDSRGDDDHAA